MVMRDKLAQLEVKRFDVNATAVSVFIRAHLLPLCVLSSTTGVKTKTKHLSHHQIG